MPNVKQKLPAFIASTLGSSSPQHVRYVWLDNQGRRCTQFVCTCESAGRDTHADAQLIAELLAKHHGCTLGYEYESAPGKESCQHLN